MPLYINDNSVYPMELTTIRKGNKIIYDRATRGKSWFYIEVVKPLQAFITADGNVFYTSDNRPFNVVKE